MPRLDNPRHEAFAQAVAKGAKGAAAYAKVYGKKVKSPRTAASALLKDSDISQRVAELQQKGADGVVMTLQQELEYLTKAILTPLGEIDEASILCQSAEYLVAGGVRGRLRRGNADRGNEKEMKEMTTVKIKMVDKLRAMELLIRLKGEFAAEKVEVKHTVTIEQIAAAVKKSPVISRLFPNGLRN